MKKKILLLPLLVIVMMLATACGAEKSALHINHSEDEFYGSGDYVFSTVTFSGSEMESETVYSVKQLEEMTEDESLAYEGLYSMLTRGSIFSQHEMTGLRLYELLLETGLDEEASDDTEVKVVSADGYTTILTLGEIRESTDNTYDSMEVTEPVEESVPVILAFGSDGIPLTGPVGSRQPGEDVPEEEGFDEASENVGGPVRLIAGQKAPDEFNAPDNAKWVREIIVGDDTDYDKHSGAAAEENCLAVTVTDEDGSIIDEKSFTYAEIEGFEGTEANYYGEENYYSGVDLWEFLASSLEFASREGTVEFTGQDGTTEEIDIEYFRNLKGDYSGYTTSKDGLTITNVKPALGYSVNGQPSEDGIYALLPAAKGYEKSSKAVPVTAITLKLTGENTLSENPYGNSKIVINGEGVDEETTLTVNQLERYSDLIVTDGTQMGISLAGLLEEIGLTVDADDVTVKGESEATYTYEQLQKDRDGIFLVTRENGQPPETGGPVKLGDVNNVSMITVGIKDGQWTHSQKPYSKFLNSKLKISGSEAAETRKYTLQELEDYEYTVKDSFGSSKGVDGYQGVILRELIKDNLKEGVERPSKITVIGRDGYKTELSVDDVFNGIDSKYQQGEHRDVILAYSLNGEPLVRNENSDGFNGENGHGPLKLIVENQISKWVKNVKEIRIGE
ncbi:MAG: hypothetical protein Q4C25_07150 [Bacillota bacterium]|nr:hypothetical protein [Bacillota bacterium]